MQVSCPISLQTIDGTVARLSALTVWIVTLSAWMSESPVWAWLLVWDFAVRLSGVGYLSVALFIAAILKRTLKLPSHFVDAAPKRVAAYFGLGFSVLLALSLALGATQIAAFVAFVLLICSGLELLFDYCVGCKVYMIYTWMWVPKKR